MKMDNNKENGKNNYCERYSLNKENIIYNISINKKENEIIINCDDYEISLNQDTISKLFSLNDNINQVYKKFTNLFDENKIQIKDILTNDLILLSFNSKKEYTIPLLNKSKHIYEIINILYNKYIISKTNENSMNNKILALNKEIKKLKNCLNKNKNKISNYSNNIQKYSKPNNINFLKNIVKDSFTEIILANTFDVFESLNKKYHLIYSTKNKSMISMICYSLTDLQIETEIKDPHSGYNITNFRHCIKNDKDIIMSISVLNKIIKLWNFENWECILSLNACKSNDYSALYSSCFLIDNNDLLYIITTNCNWCNPEKSEPMRIYNFHGKYIQEIQNSNELTLFVDTYYEKNQNTIYIITGNYNYVKSYNYNKNEIYHKYYDKDGGIFSHWFAVVNECNNNNILLIESSEDGNIRVWDFHKAILKYKINAGCKSLYGLCIWNDDYIFAGCKDNSVKLIEIKDNGKYSNLFEHEDCVCSVKKFYHEKFGECLISQEFSKGCIKLWVNINTN